MKKKFKRGDVCVVLSSDGIYCAVGEGDIVLIEGGWEDDYVYISTFECELFPGMSGTQALPNFCLEKIGEL